MSEERKHFEIGQRVGIKLANGTFPAQILEDRGPLAGNGKHVIRIATFPDDPDERDEWEVPEDSLDFEFQH